MTKTESQITDLTNALSRLEESLALPEENSITREATIQRFEFTFELSWKLMQSLLQDHNLELFGVKHIIKEATKAGLIDNPESWFKFLEARNLAAHTYNENLAIQVYTQTKSFPQTVHQLLN